MLYPKVGIAPIATMEFQELLDNPGFIGSGVVGPYLIFKSPGRSRLPIAIFPIYRQAKPEHAELSAIHSAHFRAPVTSLTRQSGH
jgi:hypothetical protein